MNTFKKWIADAFSLRDDTASYEEIYDRLVSGAQVKGTNMCVLILAVLIASIGLNMNSTAVIIGAMLISPLMGSIMAIAFGMATGQFEIAERHLLGFVLQIGISLITSTLYFSITPISASTSELLARTSPTIWDVMIAICGGIAGAIGMTRKEKSNVIPGVAIATALMPPLCTAGYGLATHQMKYFFGAAYLFLLNAYFIFFATVVVLLMLQLPARIHMSDEKLKIIRRRITVGTAILLLPSLFFAARLTMQQNITGFEDDSLIEITELGTEAEILFPQIEGIAYGDIYSYEQGEAKAAKRMIITVSSELEAEKEQTLRQWLEIQYPEADVIEIVKE